MKQQSNSRRKGTSVGLREDEGQQCLARDALTQAYCGGLGAGTGVTEYRGLLNAEVGFKRELKPGMQSAILEV